jgi:cytochrome P450
LAFQGDEIDTNYLLKECPLLKSVYLEALRLSKTDHSYRTVDRNIEVNGVLLRQGTNAILSVSELHRDESVFGSKASEFNPTRFLEQPKLASSRSFKPYGGGTTLCPGRDFALRQTMYFMALWLHKYDARIVGSLSKPQLDEEWMAIGLCRPLAGTDYTIELSIRDS